MRLILVFLAFSLVGCGDSKTFANEEFVITRTNAVAAESNRQYEELSDRIDALEAENETLKAGQLTAESLANSAIALSSAPAKQSSRDYIIWIRRGIYAEAAQHVLLSRMPADKAAGSYTSKADCIAAATAKVKELGGDVPTLTYRDPVPDGGNFWATTYICLPEGMRP